MAAHKRTLYNILGVAPDASAIDIWNAYEERKAELQNTVPQDASAMALAHQAHEVLTNPKRRAAYDASLAPPPPPPPQVESTESVAPQVEVEEDEPPHKLPWAAIAIATGVVIAGLVFGLRNRKAPPPAPEPAVAEAPKPAAPAPAAPLTSAQILAAALPSVARLQSFEMSGRAVPIGLALIVEPGVMVTTCHGIPAGSQLVASVGGQTQSAALAVTDEVLDLCKLNVPGLDARPLAMGEEPKVSDKIYALGANAGGEFALTEGIVKHLMKTPAGTVIEISVPIAPSASGGAVFDTHGKLVGIATTPHSYAAGAHIALPAGWIAQARSRGK
jgi:S1-C subfamily serine protease